jgi:hypothetical protein
MPGKCTRDCKGQPQHTDDELTLHKQRHAQMQKPAGVSYCACRQQLKASDDDEACHLLDAQTASTTASITWVRTLHVNKLYVVEARLTRNRSCEHS